MAIRANITSPIIAKVPDRIATANWLTTDNQLSFNHISPSWARPATVGPPMHFRIGALRSGVSVISDPPAFVLIGLGRTLVAMFAVAFYWLTTKDRPTPPHSPVTPLRLTALPLSALPWASTNSTNGRRSRRIPTTPFTLRMTPAPNRSIAIRLSAGVKSPPMHRTPATIVKS